MKKIDFDYLSNHTYSYKYVGDGSGDWNYYLQFKRNGTYSIQQLEYELSQLPLINECEIHLEGMTWDGFVLSVIWKGNVHWYGSFKLEYHPLDLYDTDFLKYLEDRIDVESKKSTKKFRESKKSIKESSDVAEKISSEIDKSYWIDKLIDDLDRHYESMEKAWLKNLDKLSDEDILGIIDDCMGKSKTLVGKSEMLKNKMIDDLSKAYDDYIDDIDRQIRIGKSEDEIKDMIETTLENDIKMYLKLAYNNKASSNYFMVKFAEDNLI